MKLTLRINNQQDPLNEINYHLSVDAHINLSNNRYQQVQVGY